MWLKQCDWYLINLFNFTFMMDFFFLRLFSCQRPWAVHALKQGVITWLKLLRSWTVALKLLIKTLKEATKQLRWECWTWTDIDAAAFVHFMSLHTSLLSAFCLVYYHYLLNSFWMCSCRKAHAARSMKIVPGFVSVGWFMYTIKKRGYAASAYESVCWRRWEYGTSMHNSCFCSLFKSLACTFGIRTFCFKFFLMFLKNKPCIPFMWTNRLVCIYHVCFSLPVGDSMPSAATLCSEVSLLCTGVWNETRLSAGVGRLSAGPWIARSVSHFWSSGPPAAVFHHGGWAWPHRQSSHVQWSGSQTNLLQVAPHGIQVSGPGIVWCSQTLGKWVL